MLYGTCYDHANGNTDLGLRICKSGHHIAFDCALLVGAELRWLEVLGVSVPTLFHKTLEDQCCQLPMPQRKVLESVDSISVKDGIMSPASAKLWAAGEVSARDDELHQVIYSRFQLQNAIVLGVIAAHLLQ